MHDRAPRSLWLAAAVLGSTLVSSCARESKPPSPWPPVVGQKFPDMELLDHRGKPVRLSSFAGKVLLIEPIGMPCKGCIALCGGHEHGPFKGIPPQKDLESFASYFPRYADGVAMSHEDIMVVQMLFFSESMEVPTVADARAWHDHFKLGDEPNHVVLVGPASIQEASRPKIPGYWLVDRNFELRYDGAGNGSPHNLYTDLLPAVPDLLEESANAAPR